MSRQAPDAADVTIDPAWRFAVVAARFNPDLVDALLGGCLQRLTARGVDPERVTVERVPGAFEIPTAAKWAADRGKYAAVICLGAIVRGDTPHFEYVAGACASGVSRVALDTGVPTIFGVLTTNTPQQAWDRVGGSHGHAGHSAADVAIEMAALRARLAPGDRGRGIAPGIAPGTGSDAG